VRMTGWEVILLAALMTYLAPDTLHSQRMAPATTAVGAVPDDSSIAGDRVEFSFDRTGLRVPHYELMLMENGIGQYRGEESPKTASPADTPAFAQPFGPQKISISPSTVIKVFALARRLDQFNIPCDSTAKNVADTGEKTLSYVGAQGVMASCTYNYTEKKDVQTLTDIFEGIAETLDEGRELGYLHRYDRLGLDAELESFSREVAEGHAIELQTIAQTLNSLAGDPDVMQRVRIRASGLLTMIPTQTR